MWWGDPSYLVHSVRKQGGETGVGGGRFVGEDRKGLRLMMEGGE